MVFLTDKYTICKYTYNIGIKELQHQLEENT